MKAKGMTARCRSAAIAAALLLAGGEVLAVNTSWVSPVDGNWNVSANWDHGVPVSGVDFDYLKSNVTVTVNSGQTGGYIIVQNSAIIRVTTNGYLSPAQYARLDNKSQIKHDGGKISGSFNLNWVATDSRITISDTAQFGFVGTSVKQASLHIGRVDATGTGTVVQTGGSVLAGNMSPVESLNVFVIQPRGAYNLLGGTLTFLNTTYRTVLRLAGRFNFGDANGTGQMLEHSWNSTHHVCVLVYSNGVFRGHGTVFPTVTGGTYQPLVNYGQIIADGYGTDRELWFPNFSSDKGGVQGGTNTSDKGWYARNHGKLTLGKLYVSAATNAVTWGDTISDTTPDLVNSFRAVFNNVSAAGHITGSLLATNRTDVSLAPLRSRGAIQGLWDISAAGGLAFESADLTFRYDATGIAPGDLSVPLVIQVYRHTGTAWVRVTGAEADTANYRVTAHVSTASSLGKFAVVYGAPRATVVTLL